MEKRKFTRIELPGTALLLIDNSPVVIRGEVPDVALEEARIRVQEKAPKAYLLKEGKEVQMVLKSETPVKTRGEIKWIKETDRYIEIGVKFTSMTMREQEALRVLLTKVYTDKTPWFREGITIE